MIYCNVLTWSNIYVANYRFVTCPYSRLFAVKNRKNDKTTKLHAEERQVKWLISGLYLSSFRFNFVVFFDFSFSRVVAVSTYRFVVLSSTL